MCDPILDAGVATAAPKHGPGFDSAQTTAVLGRQVTKCRLSTRGRHTLFDPADTPPECGRRPLGLAQQVEAFDEDLLLATEA
jgi:hypothetical protein